MTNIAEWVTLSPLSFCSGNAAFWRSIRGPHESNAAGLSSFGMTWKALIVMEPRSLRLRLSVVEPEAPSADTSLALPLKPAFDKLTVFNLLEYERSKFPLTASLPGSSTDLCIIAAMERNIRAKDELAMGPFAVEIYLNFDCI